MATKLSYLSKYMDGGAGREKSKKKKKNHDKVGKERVVTRDLDNDDSRFYRTRRMDHDNPESKQEDDDDVGPLPGDEDDDDGPVVVNSNDVLVPTEQRRSSSPRDRMDANDRRQRQRQQQQQLAHDTALQQRTSHGRHAQQQHPESGPRRRYDSSDDDDGAKNNNRNAQQNHSDAKDHANSGKRQGNDSVDENPTTATSFGRRRRLDSSSSSEEGSDEEVQGKRRMESGHRAGLQAGHVFSATESELRKQRQDEAESMVHKYGHGDTVYRDKSGRKVEGAVRDDNNNTNKKPMIKLTAEEQRVLNTGRVQREAEQHSKEAWARIQQSSFARHADDDELERIRKSAIRDGDPMAMYAAKKQTKVQQDAGVPLRPVYKGPPPRPNRFGIRPGYRWDGVDRGNGFEDKLLAKRAIVQHQKEQAYRWSAADM